jgi:hypothetical protein
MRIRAAVITFCLALALAGEARAQVAWDSPILLPPRPEAGTGIYLLDAHRAGLGVLGTWRGPGQNIGLRLGIAEGRRDGVAILGGIDLVSALATAGPAFPLDISWFTGVGAGMDDWVLVTVPLGLSLGRTFHGDGVRFTPYLAPRLLLDGHFDRGDRDGLELNLAIDLGFDLSFQPAWSLRFGASVGDRGGLAVGILF